MVHERVRQDMRQMLEEDVDLGLLDGRAQHLLAEARGFYRDARLGERIMLKGHEAIMILPWAGDLARTALVLLLRSLGLENGSNDGLVVRCEGWGLDRLVDACSDIVNLDAVDLVTMLEGVDNLGQSKWDWALPRDLLVKSFASLHLDIAGAKGIAARVVSAIPS